MAEIKLFETRDVLNDLVTKNFLSKRQKEAIRRALAEVETTIDNGDEGNL